jgi:hypothetical protein
MNDQALLEWICAILLVAVTGGLITFAWVKAIDGYLWVIRRLQGDSTPRRRAGDAA